MTSNPRILGSLRSADGKGIVRIQDRFGTGIGDLWSALTEPGRQVQPLTGHPRGQGRPSSGQRDRRAG